MRVRRLRKEVAHLEVTAFINLIVVLVPFLLSTAVFTRLAVLDLSLPAQSSGVEQLKVEDLKLEVVIRADAIEVSDRIGGLIKRVEGRDTKELAVLMRQIKTRFPDVSAATVLAEADTPYDALVQVMDAVREHHEVQGAKIKTVALFPDVSIGDAPMKKRSP